jgi:(p)ppGpp synthase/HD superfamily hydrolase
MISPIGLVNKAESYARLAHKGQTRKYTGVPYISHPERVARRVSEFTNDKNVVAAAWLHDTIEDCGITYDELMEEFNKEVADIVWNLTNPSKWYPELSRTDRKKMDREHLKQCSEKVQLIKCIDRIDNLNEMKEAENSFKLLYSKESILLSEVLDKVRPKELVYELRNLANCVFSEK